MRSLLNFLIRYSNIIVFLLLEGVAVYMLASVDGYHNIVISNRLKAAEGFVEKQITSATEYFKLRGLNESLAAENLQLKNRLEQVFRDDELYFSAVNDTIHRQQYDYTRAEVINQSSNRQNNFITLDKGSNDGIEPGMAVVGPDGIIGTVVGTSRNFAVAMSVLNLDFRLSARFSKNGYYGSLSWDGADPNSVSLNEIPHHVEIEIGDTIETSGYSSVFPAGVMIGMVSDYNKAGGDFYKITVDLATDFHSIRYVYIIGNLRKNEQNELQRRFDGSN